MSHSERTRQIAEMRVLSTCQQYRIQKVLSLTNDPALRKRLMCEITRQISLSAMFQRRFKTAFWENPVKNYKRLIEMYKRELDSIDFKKHLQRFRSEALLVHEVISTMSPEQKRALQLKLALESMGLVSEEAEQRKAAEAMTK